MTKLCKDCRHHSYSELVLGYDEYRFSRCLATYEVDPVSGKKSYVFCSLVRDPEFNCRCGPKGKLWEVVEPKEETPKKPSFWSRFWHRFHFGIGGR
jgi:hypothetical protein